MRDLGRVGEDTFSLWCNNVGLIPNRAGIDKTGWDFIVEFPYTNNSEKTADSQEVPIECKVQVKATDQQKRKLQITISNLQRLAQAPMPAFILFIEYNGKDNPEDAFLVHIGDDLISNILKRIREIDLSDKENRFNKRTMTISYGSSHKLSQPNGISLREKIESYIPNGMDEYVKKKFDFISSIGYEGDKITFQTIGQENLGKLIDISLGVDSEVQVENLLGKKSRFGIEDKIPFLESKFGILSMPDLKPNYVGNIRFKKSKLDSGMVFPCKIYNSALNHLLSPELVKFRIEGNFFDIRVNPFIGKASLSLSLVGIALLAQELRDAISLLSILFTPERV